MKKLTRSSRKSKRRKIKTSTTAENKLLTAIKRLFRIKLPKLATMQDYTESISKIDVNKVDNYVNQYATQLLKHNRQGFEQIVSTMIKGSRNENLQNQLDKATQSLTKESKIYKPLLDKFKYNVSLIKNIPQDVQERLKQAYLEAVSFRGTDVEKYLQNTLGKRAKLIIRTESSKVNAALTEIRAKNLGINAYVWSTSEDRRVRASHKLMDGVLVFWNTILTLDKMTGHAGEYPNCRCISLPVVSIDDLAFPIRVAEGNLEIVSKYIKGTHGKGYETQILSGKIKTYTKTEFLKVYGKQFVA